MRILSQNGMKYNDIPYEKFCFGIVRNRMSNKFCILAKETPISESGFPLSDVMAEYSTEEKAIKALEMLQKAYSPLLVIKDLGDGIEADIKPNDLKIGRTEPNGIRENYYFRFPADNEVEV